MHILFVCLLLPAWLNGALLPGDFGVVRISKDKVTILALQAIAANESIKLSDQSWKYGAFSGNGSGGTHTLTRPLEAGDLYEIDLSALGILFEWGDTLHFYQESAAPNRPKVRHLFVVEANPAGLRWLDTPLGLEPDLTHILIREISGYTGDINQVYNSGLLDIVNLNLTPYQWLQALGNYRAWIHVDQELELSLLQLLGLEFLVLPSPGVIEFMSDAYHLGENDGKITVPVRRLYGNAGTASVEVESTNVVEPLNTWENQAAEEFYADLTGIAYSPAAGYAIAVSPDTGKLLKGTSSGWLAMDTNGEPQTNLELSDVVYDGTGFWACSKQGRIYKSETGLDWSLKYAPSGTAPSLTRIVYLPAAAAQGLPALLALGEDGQILYENSSDTWQPSSSGLSDVGLFSVTFDGQNYVAVGAGGNILTTRDLAKKWESHSSPTAFDLYAVYFSPASLGGGYYVVGQFGTMLYCDNLVAGFEKIESGTSQTLFSMQSVQLEVDSSTGETVSYLVACGAAGTVTAAESGGSFTLRRSIHRASALYSILPIVSGSGQAAEALIAIGEYGAIVSLSTFSQALSGGEDQLRLNNEPTSKLSWAAGESSEKYVEVSAGTVDRFRQRTDLLLKRPIGGGNYRLGKQRTQVNLMRASDSSVALAPNFGPLLYMVDTRVEINSKEQWEFKFRLGNTSQQATGRLFLRFEDTNLPDWEIPSSLLPGDGEGMAALSVSADIVKVLSQPVESVSLYEEFRQGESVLKYKKIVNSLWADPDWSPNGIFPRSLGIYLLDDGSLLDPGIPGISEALDLTSGVVDDVIDIIGGILGGLFNVQSLARSSSVAEESRPASTQSFAAYSSMSSYSTTSRGSSGGSTFSDGVPTPSREASGDPQLILTDTDTQGPTGMELRATFPFFLEGDFYNTGTGLNEVYTMNVVDWSVSEDAAPADGLSIDADGNFEASPNPSLSYPREISIDSSTTEGAPVDDKGEPIEFTDSQTVTLSYAASDLSYADWVLLHSSLSGDDALGDADPDDDGLRNLLEFALGLDPETPDLSSVLTLTHDAASSISNFELTIPLDRKELIYTLETTSNLSTIPVEWTAQSLTLSAVDGSTETWAARIRSSGQIFGRLSIQEVAP
ncbi:hypothetical protein QEH52_08230 [Coraliomargarita sp. SDUM461003]|uniref:Photosynthesis system II assembly factor Ycf48/Hcf136-like domain-containing protein n=1 Tax=Thalassobacterium maritimum TaxID=3041265 RepID=A0ABU1ATJ6_9BACT|nr:hypothetical protein [Coraliomargarita sp. SDUM461003]MDQ8207492.1 hypothetical protein [Coraliomargarita sp. SDUM461003]